MARIAFLTSHYLPENTAASHRVSSFARKLSQNHEVEIFALGEKGQKESHLETDSGGVRIHRIHQRMYSGKALYTRFCFELYYCLRLFILFHEKKNGFDRIVISIPFLSLLLLAPVFLPLKRTVLDCRDLVWNYLASQKGLSRVVGRILGFYAGFVLPKFWQVVVTNELEKDYLHKQCLLENIAVVRNGIDYTKFSTHKELLTRSMRAGEPFRILCCGNVGRALHLDTILQAIGQMQDVEFHVVGDGNLLSEHQEKYQNSTNIKFHGKVDWEDLLPHYQEAHLLYLQVHPAYSTSRPLRLIEYLSTGLPILFAGNSSCHQTIYNLPGVFTCNALDVDSHIDFIEQFKKLPSSTYEHHQELVRKLYLREQNAAEFEKILCAPLNTTGLFPVKQDSVGESVTADNPG